LPQPAGRQAHRVDRDVPLDFQVYRLEGGRVAAVAGADLGLEPRGDRRLAVPRQRGRRDAAVVGDADVAGAPGLPVGAADRHRGEEQGEGGGDEAEAKQRLVHAPILARHRCGGLPDMGSLRSTD